MKYEELPDDIKLTIEIKKRNLEIQEGLRNLPSDWGVPKEPCEVGQRKKRSLYNTSFGRDLDVVGLLPKTRYIQRKSILKFKVGDTFREKGCPFTIAKIGRKYIWITQKDFQGETEVKKYSPEDVQRLIDMCKYRTSNFSKSRLSHWPK